MASIPDTPAKIPTLGVLEFSSVAKGLAVCDSLLKKADVRLLRAAPVGSGKFIILLTGDEANLFEAMAEGLSLGDPFLAGSTSIPNIHPQVVSALKRKAGGALPLDSVGVLESTSLASLIRAADIAANRTGVQILELTFDLDLGGKAYLAMTGDLAEVEAAMEAGQQHLLGDGVFVHGEIIARPHKAMAAILLAGLEKPCS